MAVDKTRDYASTCNINHRITTWCSISLTYPGNQPVFDHKGTIRQGLQNANFGRWQYQRADVGEEGFSHYSVSSIGT
jgi:hypothetical protein